MPTISLAQCEMAQQGEVVTTSKHWKMAAASDGQLPVVLASTSAQADAKSRFGSSAFGIVAQPAFMTKSRCSYVDLMALNAFSLVTPSGSTCD